MFLSGAVAAQLLTVESSDELDLSPPTLAAALQGAAFPIDRLERLHPGDTISGWVFGPEADQVDFEAGDRPWLLNQYAHFSYRTDELKVPAKPLRRLRKQREAAWCAEHGREKAPSAVRREIKELAENELARKVMPTSRTVELVWDTVNHIVYVHTYSEKLLGKIRSLFRASFDSSLDLTNAENALEKTEWSQTAVVPEHSVADALSREFYKWLWFTTEVGGIIDIDHDVTGGSLTSAGIEFWLEEKAVLNRHEDSANKTTLSAENLNEQEILTSMRQGKGFAAIGIHLRREDREYSATLEGEGLHVKSLKLPPARSRRRRGALRAHVPHRRLPRRTDARLPSLHPAAGKC